MPILELDYIHARIERSDGHWLWTGGNNGKGYGIFHFRGVRRYAHRLMYERCVGPIPDGLELDHLCRVTLCCNPEHLEPVSHAENTRRSPFIGAKTHCKHGHLFDEANTYITPAGARRCRSCHARREADRRARADT